MDAAPGAIPGHATERRCQQQERQRQTPGQAIRAVVPQDVPIGQDERRIRPLDRPARRDPGCHLTRRDRDRDFRDAGRHVPPAGGQESGPIEDEGKAGHALDLGAFRLQAVGELPGLVVRMRPLRRASVLDVKVRGEAGKFGQRRALRRLGYLGGADPHGVDERVLRLQLDRVGRGADAKAPDRPVEMRRLADDGGSSAAIED